MVFAKERSRSVSEPSCRGMASAWSSREVRWGRTVNPGGRQRHRRQKQGTIFLLQSDQKPRYSGGWQSSYTAQVPEQSGGPVRARAEVAKAAVALAAAAEINQRVFEDEGNLVPTSQTWANAQAFASMNNAYLAQYGVHAVVTGIAVND